MKNTSTEQRLDDLFCRARGESPLGQARDYGFETRLRESISKIDAGTLDYFATLCWRFSLVCLPVVLPAIVAITMMNGGQLPEGVSALVGYFNLGAISGF